MPLMHRLSVIGSFISVINAFINMIFICYELFHARMIQCVLRDLLALGGEFFACDICPVAHISILFNKL